MYQDYPTPSILIPYNPQPYLQETPQKIPIIPSFPLPSPADSFFSQQNPSLSLLIPISLSINDPSHSLDNHFISNKNHDYFPIFHRNNWAQTSYNVHSLFQNPSITEEFLRREFAQKQELGPSSSKGPICRMGKNLSIQENIEVYYTISNTRLKKWLKKLNPPSSYLSPSHARSMVA